VLGHVVDDSWRAPLPGTQIILQAESGTYRGAVSDSAGLFRIDSVPPGAYRLRVKGLCFQPLDRPLFVSTESRVVDIGTVVAEHARPRLHLTHVMCQATKEEDSETRLLLEAMGSDSAWLAFAQRHPDEMAPVSSVWLRWGSSVFLFGEKRDVLSPVETGTSGLITVANRRIYDGPFFVVSLNPGGANAVLSVIAPKDPRSIEECLFATFRRSSEGWTLISVRTLATGWEGGIEERSGGRREAGIP
jgi:hypothetical protein